jgi:hypothetical protein
MQRTVPWFLMAFAGLALSQLPACTEQCDCSAEAPWLTVTVVDASDGGVIPTAQVNGQPCPGSCGFRSKPDGGPASAGPVDLTVTAPSYEPRSLTVVIPATTPVDHGCCGIGPPWIGQFVSVPLQPL